VVEGAGDTSAGSSDVRYGTIMEVTTLNVAGQGFRDGLLDQAQFSNPAHCACDADGNPYIADSDDHRIRKVAVDGVVSTIAGDGTAGYQDGPGAAARFIRPNGVAVGASGTLYVADCGGHRIRQITPEGVVSTRAGSGEAGFVDGQGTDARFHFPAGIAVDSQGNIFVNDYGNHRICKITPVGEVTTLAGSGAASRADAPSGPGTSAGFDRPTGIVADNEGNIYLSEYGNDGIRKLTLAGAVTTLAGGGGDGGAAGFQDGVGSDARFDSPCCIAVDGDGNVFVADNGNHRIWQVTPDGTVTTVAGNGALGTADGTGTAMTFHSPYGIAIDPEGNIIVTELMSHRIHKIIAGLTPPLGPPQPEVLPEVPSSTHFEENKIVLGDPTFADVAFVVKLVDDQAGRLLRQIFDRHRIISSYACLLEHQTSIHHEVKSSSPFGQVLIFNDPASRAWRRRASQSLRTKSSSRHTANTSARCSRRAWAPTARGRSRSATPPPPRSA